MKKIILLATVLINFYATSQVSFNLNFGQNNSNAQFGYVYKKFNPYLSFQYLGFSASSVYSGKENDPFTGEIVSFEDEYSTKITLLMPSIGLKYFVLERNKLKAYTNLFYSKPIVRAKLDVDDPAFENDVESAIEDLKFNAIGVGIGAEYFFDSNFSIGGEFGFVTTRVKSELEYEQNLFDPNTGSTIFNTNKINIKGALNPTYARFSLNFYFGK
jgi:hypothetical protein